MRKETDFQGVRNASKILFDCVSFEDAYLCIPEEFRGLFISHPYTNTGLSWYPNGKVMDLIHDTKAQDYFRTEVFKRIDKDDLTHIFMMLNKPYYLMWFKLINRYLSDKDYGEMLSTIWVQSENPNNDVNVNLNEIKQLFAKANKKYLMTEEDYLYYKSLPEKMTVWRGVSSNRNPYGLSYTDDKEKAIWFQRRFETKNSKTFLIELEIDKKDTYCYFNTRDEKEIVLNTSKYKKEIGRCIKN